MGGEEKWEGRREKEQGEGEEEKWEGRREEEQGGGGGGEVGGEEGEGEDTILPFLFSIQHTV